MKKEMRENMWELKCAELLNTDIAVRVDFSLSDRVESLVESGRMVTRDDYVVEAKSSLYCETLHALVELYRSGMWESIIKCVDEDMKDLFDCNNYDAVSSAVKLDFVAHWCIWDKYEEYPEMIEYVLPGYSSSAMRIAVTTIVLCAIASIKRWNDVDEQGFVVDWRDRRGFMKRMELMMRFMARGVAKVFSSEKSDLSNQRTCNDATWVMRSSVRTIAKELMDTSDVFKPECTYLAKMLRECIALHL